MPREREKITIILNPASGRGRGARRRPELEQLLRQAAEPRSPDLEWEIVETGAPGDAIEISAAAARNGATIVAAAGGDGTLNEVLNGIFGSSTRMAVLPLGTGNDFARTLGFGSDLRSAVVALFHGRSRPVDVGKIHGRWFLNVAECGFDAAVGVRVNEGFRYLTGTWAYIAALLQTLRTFRPINLTLTIDGEARQTDVMMCTVCNAQLYGGGMRIAPDASIDDGLFDICIIEAVGKLELISAFPSVYKGTHTRHPRVTMLRGATVRIESERPLPIVADGDLTGKTPAEFTIMPRAIEIMVPEG